MTHIHARLVQGGGVPGGHYVIHDGVRKPFITPTKECQSIPLRFSDVVVDVGAYVGTYAIRCARLPVQRVVAYEPTPRTFAILSRTRLPNLELVQAAVVGDDRPTTPLFLSGGIGVTNSIILSHRKVAAVEVPAVSYQDAVRGASVVKVDVEGAEYTFPLVQPSLRALIIDFHPIPGRDWKGRAWELIREIEAAGFVPVVQPDFDNGWTSAGSWLRDRETTGGFEPMLSGQLCCGCGQPVQATARALCPACWQAWWPKHRAGYVQG